MEMVKEGQQNFQSATLVRRIVLLQQQLEEVKFQYVLNEGNKVADWLARSSSTNDVHLVCIDAPSVIIRKLLFDDKCNFTYAQIERVKVK